MSFLDNDTRVIAWKGMEKVTFKIKVTNDELEHRVVSINLGDGELAAEGRVLDIRTQNGTMRLDRPQVTADSLL